MNALLRSLITFLYPAQCRHCEENLDPADGHYICKACWQAAKLIEKPYCETCGYPWETVPEKIPSCRQCPDNALFRKARSVAVYDSVVGTALRLLKYSNKTVMAKPLAELMIDALPVFFGMEDYDYIIPVPLHKKRRRERGYNQVELIGEELSRTTGIPMEAKCLVKTKDTERQEVLSGKERLDNVKGCFDITDPSRTERKRILLIDDVFTTGATVTELTKVLLRKGKAKYVDVFTLLRVVINERVIT